MRVVTDLTFAADSRVRIHTFAEGLLSRLAHDLEIEAVVTGTARRDDGDGGTAILHVPLGKMKVVGVLKSGRVDTSVLSESDRQDIVAKMLADVFHARAADEVRIDATLEGKSAALRLSVPSGKVVELRVTVEPIEQGGTLRVTGTTSLRLGALGSNAIKGPMGAFRVKDEIAVHWDLVLQPA